MIENITVKDLIISDKFEFKFKPIEITGRVHMFEKGGRVYSENNQVIYYEDLDGYWEKIDEEFGNYIGTNCPQIEMLTTTGKKAKLKK